MIPIKSTGFGEDVKGACENPPFASLGDGARCAGIWAAMRRGGARISPVGCVAFPPRAGRALAQSALACKGIRAYIRRMNMYLNMGDRTRLRERFYGESLSILARL